MKRSRNVVDLPQELIGEILLRLPVKALLRFKCVCKEWCALIGSKRFIDGHYCHESNPDCHLVERTFLFDDKREFSMYEDDGRHLQSEASNYLSQILIHDNKQHCSLLGPANGIFCAVRQDVRRIALLNPATRKLKPLPPFPLPEWNPYLTFGFGIDPFSGDYKMVVFGGTRYFCVYNSSSDSWRRREVADWMKNAMFGDKPSEGLLLNGVLHWFVDSHTHSILNALRTENFHDKKSILIAFDMRSEKFHEILAPDAIRSRSLMHVSMTAYDNSIAMLSHDEENEKVDLWVMGRDGVWIQRFSIKLPQSHMRPLCMRNKNQLLLRTYFDRERVVQAMLRWTYFSTHNSEIEKVAQGFFLWDISTQKLQKLGSELKFGTDHAIFSYKQSLVSFKGETDCVGDFFDKKSACHLLS